MPKWSAARSHNLAPACTYLAVATAFCERSRRCRTAPVCNKRLRRRRSQPNPTTCHHHLHPAFRCPRRRLQLSSRRTHSVQRLRRINHTALAMSSAHCLRRRAALPVARPNYRFPAPSRNRHHHANGDASQTTWFDEDTHGGAIQTHLRREMQVNIQTYLQDAGVAPTTAAIMSTDIVRDV